MFAVKLQGIEQAQKRLRELDKSIDPVLRGSVNSTATATRTKQYANKMKGSFPGQFTRQRIKVKRANRRYSDARLIPSSAGIEVPDYKLWGYDPIDKTRARIWVLGPNGRKIAAGFVNPSSSKRLPWATKSEKRTARKTYTYGRDLTTAQGPSMAYWFRQLTDTSTIRWVNTFLQQEFAKRIRKELAK